MNVHLRALAWLACAGCANNVLLPEGDVNQVQSELVSHARYARVAFRVTPLYQDDGKWLLSDRALDEVDLIDGTDGQPVPLGPQVGILPPGTRLRIDRVEFPTSLALAERVLYSPRYSPWIYLVPADAGPAATLAQGKPYILVLQPQLKTANQVLAEIDRYLAREDPSPALRQLPSQTLEAIAQKRLVQSMTPDEVQMAWGYPERIHLDEAQHTQLWTWPLGKQTAYFTGAGLVRWSDHGSAGDAPVAR